MKCFEHQEMDAVGICKVCGKGICPECAIEQEDAITCTGQHEAEARELRKQILKSRNVLQMGRRNRYMGPLLFGFMGSVFLIFDFYKFGPRLSFPSVFGGGILLFALYMLFAYRGWGQGAQNRDENR